MKTETNTEKHIYRDIVEWMEALLISFVLIVLLYTFFFRVITVSGGSMENTLNDGDRMIVRCVAYTPRRGDVIVVDSYSHYGAPLVKRIIAVAGDEVNIDFKTGAVTVNGQQLDEPYLYNGELTHASHDVTFPLTVKDGCVFVLGDHRAVSLDSRSSEIGQIDNRDILGKVIWRLYPFSEMGAIK